MAWSEIKYSINESLGNSNFLPLNKLIYNRSPLGLEGYTSYYSNATISTLNQNVEVVDVTGEGYLSFALINLGGKNDINLTITIDDQIIFKLTNGSSSGGIVNCGITNILYVQRDDSSYLIANEGTRGNIIPLTSSTNVAKNDDKDIRFSGNDFYFKKSLKIVVNIGTATNLCYLYHVKSL